MLTKVVKAKTDRVCYFCGRTIKKREKYVKVLSPFQRSIGMEAICLNCAEEVKDEIQT